MHTWIKFCGTTSVEDALGSVEAGADALGFIFAPSRRQVSMQQAQAIIRELPANIERIGVFVDGAIDEIGDTIAKVDLTGVQLHGNQQAPEIYRYLPAERRESLRIIKKVPVQDGFYVDLAGLDGVMAHVIDAWLLDPGAGSGKPFDWLAARKQLAGRRGPFIVAGGLMPENVTEAIRIFSPWGVDVVSGIEAAPRRKDRGKMNAFVTAVRKAEQP